MVLMSDQTSIKKRSMEVEKEHKIMVLNIILARLIDSFPRIVT